MAEVINVDIIEIAMVVLLSKLDEVTAEVLGST
jgi:hypothetical protein